METKLHVCPVWIGYLMNNPLRKLQQNPYKILWRYAIPGSRILEIGPAMGFFSVPMASMIAPDGKLYCVDIQQGMLDKLEARMRRRKLEHITETILSTADSMQIDHLKAEIDFCLLAFVVHEIPGQKKFFREIACAMKKGGRILFMEPSWHVKKDDWEKSLNYAVEAGFTINPDVMVKGCRSCELEKS